MNITLSNALTYVGKRVEKGELRDIYSPFFNLVSEHGNLSDFTTTKLNFDRQHPVDITIQDSYDGSVNLILNDDKNRPRLVNSRFTVQEDKTFLIPDHKGMKDTNLYAESTFDIDTSLKRITVNIPKLEFVGLEDGGNMKCGSYTFYFKLADADDNETEVIAESGLVQCHVGKVNTPGKMRMGMKDENSQKIVKFKLSNIDSGFDYIKVLYVRISTDNTQAVVPTYHMIDYKFPIDTDGTCNIYIRGTETVLDCTEDDILTDYADIEAVKTQEQDDNILFFGNIAKPEHNWNALSQFARQITASVEQKTNIGFLDQKYEDTFEIDEDHKLGYYNMKNVYYRVGYWPDEFYRFGIVYIFHDDSLSPVFNILGGDLSDDAHANAYKAFVNSEILDYEPESGFYDKDNFINSRGVIRLPKKDIFQTNKIGVLTASPLSVKFTYNTGRDGISTASLFNEHKVKGYFFVRQKRVPTIAGQGVVIGKTKKDFGSIPVLYSNGKYQTRGFLQSTRILEEGKDSNISIPTANAANNALLMPDAILRETDYNQLFVSNDWALDPAGACSFSYNNTTGVCEFKSFKKAEEADEEKVISKLTTVPEDVRILTNGEVNPDGTIKDEDYFSSMAGNSSAAYKTSDVNHAWDKTLPQDLTASTSVIRGQFGPYVGMSYTDYTFGTLVTVKKEQAMILKESDFNENEFSSRIFDSAPYYAISDRTPLTTDPTFSLVCYRGDCFTSFFTHRIIRNFIDPDLPTNTQVVDPATWAKNYAVRCTCDPDGNPYSNLKKDYTGWYIKASADDTGGAYTDPADIKLPEDDPEHPEIEIRGGENPEELDTHYADEYYAKKIVNEVARAFEVYVGSNRKRKNTQRVVEPESLENDAAGLSLKSLFKIPENWELRGLANLNRADVNAIPIGQWITFPACSSMNICLRDVDFEHPDEQSIFSQKRSFYPLEAMNSYTKIADSRIINGACTISLPARPNMLIPDVPFFRQEFNNRVYYSDFDATNRIRNSYRIFREYNFEDYPKMYGSIVRLIEHNKQLICVCEHGVLILPVHERIEAGAGVGGNVYINQHRVLPESPVVVTDEFGSMWKDSVFSTKHGVYGVDTVAKKIWKYSDKAFQCISDLKVQKFLNDHLDMSEFDLQEYVGHINVKTHYNDFKHDVVFTYYRDIPVDTYGNTVTPTAENFDHWRAGETWSICYNEDLDQFITYYDWIPVESTNVDNIWYSFDRDKLEEVWNYKAPILTTPVKKARIDRAFSTETEKIYFSGLWRKTISLPSKFSALTFYIKTEDSPVDFKLTQQINNRDYKSIYNFSISASDSWQFITLLMNNELVKTAEVTMVAQSGTAELCELKVTPIDEDDLEFRQLFDEISEPDTYRAPIYTDPNNDTRFISLRGDRPFMELWKHGQAGLYDNQGQIKPTHWYGKQHEFNFEFVVAEQTVYQKIFNNLKMIANKVEPKKFEFEIDGDCYDWSEYKEVIEWINHKAKDDTERDSLYEEVLSTPYGQLRNAYIDFPQLFGRDASYLIKKLPYIRIELSDRKGTKDNSLYINQDPEFDYLADNSTDLSLVEDLPLSEKRVHTEQLGNNIRKYGRLRGNMEYLEDAWDVEIRPIHYIYAYFDNGLKFSKPQEARLRDKYLRVKVRYSGEELAVIQGIITLFDYSFA